MKRGYEIRERFAYARARLEQLHSAVVVPVRDVGGHVPLAPPVLVLSQLRRDRPPLPQRVHDVEGVDPQHRLFARHFHDDVKRCGAVVDDAETDTAVVQSRGNVEIGSRRVEPPARVVVQQHLAPLRHSREREHHVHGSARDCASGRDHAVPVHLGDERHFAAAGLGDFAGQVRADARGDALGGMDGHVCPGQRMSFGISVDEPRATRRGHAPMPPSPHSVCL